MMNELSNKHSHPSVLKGESVDSIIKETEKYKKSYELAERKINDVKMQSES